MRAFWLALLAAGAALAHQPSLSYSELRVRDRGIECTLRISLADLRTRIRIEDPRAPPVPALTRLLLEAFQIRASDRPCALQPGATAEADGEDGLALHAQWLCPDPITEVSVRVGFLEALPPGHTHLARVDFAADEVSQRVAQTDQPWFEARRTRSVWREAWRFLRLGVEHIFTGYDHIAFLIGLLLLGGTLLDLVKIVTAFTVAHSITLALAALDLVVPSSRVIEPLIAASILFVGVENLWALRGQRAESAMRHRWMLSFGFGLAHGFGFAAVLRQLQLPRASLAAGLVSFNLGVECGQICIVVIALPLLRQLRRLRAFAAAASACVAALGGVWLVDRLFFSR
ncbi:MAG TPA: HupE/UreJ family protein [Myxococcales bacterium]|nr:HupE/UreJ family protein [Myxococcales bacterium]